MMNEKTKSMGSISQIILQKEKELHQMHDMRCSQLEHQLMERERLLKESGRRFEQLKEDFQYNLALIEARDKEIDRLENASHQIKLLYDECDKERKSLMLKVDALQQIENEKEKQLDQDKQNNKRILDELKSTVEAVRWAAEGDVAMKQKEIDQLKVELKRLSMTKEEALEHQRRDLTGTFEQIIHQREQTNSLKEQEISKQIGELDRRFEIILTENTRLKNALLESQRKVEQLTNEITAKEETKRQLQWQLEDERTNKGLTDDSLERKFHQLTMESTAEKDSLLRQKDELEKKYKKVVLDFEREKETRTGLEKRMEEMRKLHQQDIKKLHSEIREMQENEMLINHSFEVLKEERDSAFDRAASMRVEIDTLEPKCRTLLMEKDSLRLELATVRERLTSAENRIATLDEQLHERRIELAEKEKQATELVLRTKSGSFEQVTKLSAEHQAELRKITLKYERECDAKVNDLESRYNGVISKLQHQLSEKTEEFNETRKTLNEKTNELDHEKKESSALKLRLKLYEDQLNGLQKEMYQLQHQQRLSAAITGPNQSQQQQYGSPGFGYKSQERLSDPRRRHENQYQTDSGGLKLSTSFGDRDGQNSPMFSEDLGPVSMNFPDSPMINPTRKNGVEVQLPQEELHQIQTILDENERLKRVVREMREDVEQLQSNAVNQNKHQSDSEGSTTRASGNEFKSDSEGKGLQDATLQKRLKQSMDEVQRLRDERRRLMDVGNELRSTLNKVHHQYGNQNVQLIEDTREQNIDTIFNWLQGPNSGQKTSSPLTHGQTEIEPEFFHTSSPNTPRKSGGARIWGDDASHDSSSRRRTAKRSPNGTIGDGHSRDRDVALQRVNAKRTQGSSASKGR